MIPPIPSVRHYVTRFVHSVEPNTPTGEAYCLMREHSIRHLPVMEQGTLVGIVTQRDLNLLQTLRDVDGCELPVEDLMETDVFTVGPEAGIDDVALEMADRKLGSVVVLQDGEIYGLFTTTDALRALSAFARNGG